MPDDGFVIDVSEWTMEDSCAFGEALKTAEGNYSPRVIFPLAARIVKQWPFAGDPSDAKSYLRLKVSEWKAVFQKIQEAIQGTFQ